MHDMYKIIKTNDIVEIYIPYSKPLKYFSINRQFGQYNGAHKII